MTHAPCRLCGVRLDPAVGATHPGCDPGPPLDDTLHDALVAIICDQLGARPLLSQRNDPETGDTP